LGVIGNNENTFKISNKKIRKMKKNKSIIEKIVALTIFSASAMNLFAQVTIGALEPPHAAAVLDLSQVPSRNLGLLMPRVKLEALNLFSPLTGAKEDAAGMWIYNTAYSPPYDPRDANSFCPGIYVYNGTDWNRIGETCQIPVTDPLTATTCSNNITVPSVRFMTYNLGADPTYDTPKKQMAYIPTSQTDAHVYGGLYQWGRSDLTHGASTDGSYVRYNGATNAVSATTNTPANGTFYMASSDWKATRDDTLWGNGKGMAADGTIDKGGVKFTDDNYYQNTDWLHPENNPCPTGWRVPTQDELMRFMAYNCNPSQSNTTITSLGSVAYFNAMATSNGGITSPSYIIVKVRNGLPTTSIDWAANETTPGMAVYLKSQWETAIATGGYLAGLQQSGAGMPGGKRLYDTDAPNPVLFLPFAGYRNTNGTLTHVGTYGDYWSSTIKGTYGQEAYLRNDQVNFTYATDHRAYGYSIRCCLIE
jgi:hypothetical protein